MAKKMPHEPQISRTFYNTPCLWPRAFGMCGHGAQQSQVSGHMPLCPRDWWWAGQLTSVLAQPCRPPLLTRTMDVQIFPYLMILDKNKNINTNSKSIKQTHQYKQTNLTKKKTIKCHKSKTIICNNHKKHEPKCTVLAPNHSTPPVYCVLEKYLYF